MSFADRADAGRRLGAAVQHLRGQDLIVCGLPRGGVPVAYEVACVLEAPLDVIVVRKLGFPGQPELAMGAMGELGARFMNASLVRQSGLTDDQLAEMERAAGTEVRRAALTFRNGRDPVDRAGRAVLIVDDGIATGSTARAACHVVRTQGVARVVLAVPVAPKGWIERMGEAADDYVCVEEPEHMRAVGNWYVDFTATTDKEVVDCLTSSQQWRH